MARVWLERGTEQGKEKTEIIIMILIPKAKVKMMMITVMILFLFDFDISPVLKRAMKMLIGKGSFYFQACLCLKHSWHA